MAQKTGQKRRMDGGVKNWWAFITLGIAMGVSMGLLHWAFAAGEQDCLYIAYTGNTMGQLEPCGCGGSMFGGLAQRSALLKQLAAEFNPLLILDTGNVSDSAAKLRPITRAMKIMGYEAVGVGPLDLFMGEAFTHEMELAELPLFSLLLKPHDVKENRRGYRIVNKGQHRIALVSISLPPEAYAGNTPELPAEASIQVAQVLTEADQQSDCVVAISHLGPALDARLWKNLTTFPDIWIGGPEYPKYIESNKISVPSPMNIFGVDNRGRQIGLIKIDWRGEARQISSDYRAVDPKGPVDPEVQAFIQDYYASQAAALREKGMLASGNNDIAVQPYVTSDQCGECHRPQYDAWLKQRHARAEQTLLEKDRAVPECLNCHSERYRRTGLPPVKNAMAGGIECSTCHGEGIVHSLVETKDDIMLNPGIKHCLECHTEERDSGFKYQEDLEKIHH